MTLQEQLQVNKESFHILRHEVNRAVKARNMPRYRRLVKAQIKLLDEAILLSQLIEQE